MTRMGLPEGMEAPIGINVIDNKRTLILTRTTELNADQKLLARQLNLTLPP